MDTNYRYGRRVRAAGMGYGYGWRVAGTGDGYG